MNWKKRLDQNIYLLYGDNEGYKEEIIKIFFKISI